MNRAKVVHIITKMELGGAQQNTLFTVSHLNPQKFKPFLITGKDGELIEDAKAFGSTLLVPDLVREINPLKDLKAFLQLRKCLEQIKFESPSNAPIIVHTHSSKAGILGRWAARCAGITTIIHSVHGFGFHDYQPFWLRRLFIFLERLTAMVTMQFIVVCKANMDQGVNLGIFHPKKVTLIRSGIDIKNFQDHNCSKEQVRQSLGLPPKAPVVAMIACLKPQKAPLDFVRICDLIRKDKPAAHFLLVGDGSLRQVIEEEIAKRKLNENFHLLGWRRDIARIFQAIDILALTSRWEGLPRVFPQAMAAGIPIVATRVDGASEAIREDHNGFLISPGDIHAMAQKIIKLLDNPQKAQAMGKNGLELVKEFDIYRMVYKQEVLYETTLSGLTKSGWEGLLKKEA